MPGWQISNRRHRKGIAYTARVKRPWTNAELKLVGKLPDHEVATRTGHPLSQIEAKRLHFGIRSGSERKPTQSRCKTTSGL